MKLLTKNRLAVAAALSAVAIALPSMGAAAAAPVSSASKFAAAVQNRVSLDINKIKYMPHALKQNQSVRVLDRKSTRLNSSHVALSRMPSSA